MMIEAYLSSSIAYNGLAMRSVPKGIVYR